MTRSPRARSSRGRAAFWAAVVSVLAVGSATSVGADPLNSGDGPAITGNSPDFDIEQIPAQVLDDETIQVTGAGIFIDEPEPFAGWPIEIIEQSIEAESSGTPEGASEAPSASEAFILHSRPGANRTIYLDFDGHTTTGTEWNKNGRPASFTSAPYSRDSNAAFNTTELSNIGEIWEHVAEDFAPFNVDVTTEEPAFDDLWRSSHSDIVYGTRVVISPTNDWYGSSGGVAYVGSFSWSNERTPAGDPVVTPGFVFSDALAGGVPKYVAEAASHEAGHTLSLYHDGKDSLSYYGGHTVENGSSRGGWAPIMGVGYQRDVTQWSNGNYPGATQLQDDIAILASRLGWASSASSVVGPATLLDGETIVGTVEQSTDDVDVEIVVESGTTSITIVPDVDDSNLLISAQLLSAITVIATASPNTAIGWQLNFTEDLAAGTYTVRLSSIGWGDVTASDLDGFTKYGSLGRFRMSLDVEPDNSTVTTTSSPTTTSTTTTSQPTTTPATTTTTTTTTPTTTSTTSTTSTTTVPPSSPLSTSNPAGCETEQRRGLMGFGEQQAAAPCFSPAQRLG
jgi:hypothetical protein